MPLLDLPNELLQIIIEESLPESFEGLALTSRRLFDLSKPFLKHHNELRARFTSFSYPTPTPTRRDIELGSAWELIARITDEPIIARYIQHADFSEDSVWDPDQLYMRDKSITKRVLLACLASPYLKLAELDPVVYHQEAYREALGARSGYSMTAAVFVLTLLPNAKSIILPRRWHGIRSKHAKILDSIVWRAQQPSTSRIPPSLGNLVSLHSGHKFGRYRYFPWSSTTRLLALPRLQNISYTKLEHPWNNWDHCSVKGHSIRSVMVANDFLYPDEIGKLLTLAPNVEKLRFSYTVESRNCTGGRRYSVGGFLAVVESVVGSQLKTFSFSLESVLSARLEVETISLRGFRSLTQLELDIEVLMCAANSRKQLREAGTFGPYLPLIAELMPPSVAQFSVLTRRCHSEGVQGITPFGWYNLGPHNLDYETALEVVFGNFAQDKETHLPALVEIFLESPVWASFKYRNQCHILKQQARRSNVAVRIMYDYSTHTRCGRFRWREPLPTRFWDEIASAGNHRPEEPPAYCQREAKRYWRRGPAGDHKCNYCCPGSHSTFDMGN